MECVAPFAARLALALICGVSLATRWVPSEINVAEKPSGCGLRQFTKDRPHHPATRRRRRAQNPALRVASQPAEPARVIRGIRFCGIADPELKGEVSRKRSPVIAVCKEGKEHPGPDDAERPRAVAAPVRVLNAKNLRISVSKRRRH